MMNLERLQLMSTLLGEITAGTWKQTVFDTVDGAQVHVVAFDITDWATHTEGSEQLPEGGNNIKCGFSACAVGHACFDDRFTAQGLSFDLTLGSPVVEGLAYRENEQLYERRWRGVNTFFNITPRTGDLLFYDGGYVFNDEYMNEGEGIVTKLADGVEHGYDGEISGVTPAVIKDRIDDLIKLGEAAFQDKYQNFKGE